MVNLQIFKPNEVTCETPVEETSSGLEKGCRTEIAQSSMSVPVALVLEDDWEDVVPRPQDRPYSGKETGRANPEEE